MFVNSTVLLRLTAAKQNAIFQSYLGQLLCSYLFQWYYVICMQ